MKLIISPVPGHVPSAREFIGRVGDTWNPCPCHSNPFPKERSWRDHSQKNWSRMVWNAVTELPFTFLILYGSTTIAYHLSIITVPIFRDFPYCCSCLARRQGTIKLVWYPKGDVKQVPAAKVMTCARALMLFCWQVISVGAQVLRAMVANMGPMMASGPPGKVEHVEAATKGLDMPWYLQDPWWPEVQKNGWKRLGIERQNLRMLKDLRFSTRFHPNPWGSHTQYRQYQPHFPPAAQLQLWQSCSWTLSGRRRENTPPPESRWGHRAWHTSSALWPQTWAWPSCWDQTLPCLLFHCSSTNINNTTHLQKKTCKKQHLVNLGGVLVCCAYP